MATLTEVGSVTRKVIKIFFAALVVLVISPYILKAAKNLYLSLNPPPPEAPNVKYGALPKIEFPEMALEASPEYKLETITGGLPEMPPSGKVYLVGINKYRLLTLDRVKQKVKVLGFINEPQELSDQLYRFYHPQIPAILTYNIFTNEFNYQYDWTQDVEIPTAKTIPVGSRAVDEAKRFFAGLDALADDLDKGEGKITYFKTNGNTMQLVDNVYEANFVRVDLFRKDRDDLKVVTTGGDISPVSIIFSGITGNRRVVLANYQYSPVIDDDFGTYPLKPIEKAWQELISGEGYVAKINNYKVTVRQVSMGYYESHKPQRFLQPVYIFEGDNGFMAYVPAIDQSQSN